MPESARKLLFVCSGNVCRSPMAAALAEWIAMQQGAEVEVRSAGTLGLVDRPADPKVVAVCRELGLDLSGHRSAALTPELLAWADRVYVMEDAHAVAARALWPDLAEDAVVPLGPLVGKPDIADPIGSWFKSTFRATRDDLREAVLRALRATRR
jgi:protein-tyrosine-phosphatase